MCRVLRTRKMLGSHKSGSSKVMMAPRRLLGGSWDLVSKVISTLIGVITKYNYSYLISNPSY